MVDYHTNSVIRGLVLNNASDTSKDTIFDRYGPIASAEVDSALKAFAESVPFAALPSTPQTVQTLTNILIAIYYYIEIKANPELNIKPLEVRYNELLLAAIAEFKASATSRTGGPLSVQGSYESPLIVEADWNGVNSDIGRTY